MSSNNKHPNNLDQLARRAFEESLELLRESVRRLHRRCTENPSYELTDDDLLLLREHTRMEMRLLKQLEREQAREDQRELKQHQSLPKPKLHTKKPTKPKPQQAHKCTPITAVGKNACAFRRSDR